MFSLGRHPKLIRDRDAAPGFVPIGQRIISPERQQARPSTSSNARLTGEKVDNYHIESSFDENSHNLTSIQDLDGDEIAMQATNPGWNSRGNATRSGEQRNRIVEGGKNSIHEIQAESQQLKSENYNLKVEVATLKQFLKSTPPETRELVSLNAALKQELIKTQDELENVRNNASSHSDRTSEHNRETDTLKAVYRDSLAEKDYEIQKLHRKLSEQPAPVAPKIPQELLDKVEFLQNENQSLLRQLDGSNAASDKNRGQFQSENNDLKLELHRLRTQLAEIPIDARDQLDHLQNSNDTLEKKLRAVSLDLEQAEDEKNAMRSTLRALQMSVDEKQATIENLSRFKEETVSSRSRTSKDAESKLERAQLEVEDLRLKLKRAEAAISQAEEESVSEKQRLQRKLDVLRKDLKEKDRDEYTMKTQIRSLMTERNKAFDNQSTIEHYQSQIDGLRAKERTLLDDNARLKEDMAKLQDELYSQNVDSSRVGKLKQENTDLLDRLDFYEKEYGLTLEAMEGVEAELEALKTDQKRSVDQRHLLETELETMRTKLRRSELSDSRKYNESAYMELEEKHRRREEAEYRRMTSQISALTSQIADLEKMLESAKREKEKFPAIPSYQPASDVRLRQDLQSRDFELQEKQREFLKLQTSMKDKEDLIEALEDRIRKLNKEFRSDFSADDRYRETIQRLKLDHDSEMLAVQLERDRLQNEVKHYKIRLENMMDDDDTQAPSGANSVTIALLEAQLDDFRRKNSELLAQLDKLSVSRLESTNRDSDELRTKIRELRFALSDLQQEKADLESSRDALESDLSLIKSEKSRVETRNRSLSQELTKNGRSCTRLANKVQELEGQISSLSRNADDVYRTQKSNLQLQSQVDQLGARLATANLASQPTQQSQSLVTLKNRLQENEAKYLKAKLYELQTRYMDLALMNSFIVSSIRNSSHTVKDDLIKMARVGIYPDYSALERKTKKLTLKTLAQFVLAAVRMRRRAEKAKTRETKLTQLRSEIERDRITLLVER